MKRKSIKIILVIVTLVIAATLLTTTVKATGNPLNIQLPGSNQGGSGTVNVTQNPNNQGTQKTNTAPVNTQGSTYQNKNLPQTGDASDYVIFLFIAVCAVVAVFAYKKYRNYNI